MIRVGSAALLAALVAAAALMVPQLASASAESELQKARDAFEYGDYERAREGAEDLLRRNVLSRDEQLIDANRIVALAYLYGKSPDRKEKATRYFLQLLSIEPEYRLDPFFTPPAAVEFFDTVRRDHEEQLAPIREQRRVAKEARRAEELARQRFLDEQARAAARANEGAVSVVERRHLALVFLPFGAGQFQNGDTTAGTILASIQLVAGTASVASFLAVHDLSAGGKVRRADLPLARNLDTIKWSTAAIFYLAWGYGVVQAWNRFEPEVSVGVVEPATAASPASGPPRIVPVVSADEDGATLGLSMRF